MRPGGERGKMIDRSLNYGREHIARFTGALAPCERAVDLGAGPVMTWRRSRAHPNCELHAVEVYGPYARELERQGVTVHARCRA